MAPRHHRSPESPVEEVVEDGDGEEHAVHAVQEAAVAGQDAPAVLDRAVALEQGLEEISELPRRGEQEPHHHDLPRREEARPVGRQHPRAQHRAAEATQHALHRLARAHRRAERVAAPDAAHEVGEGVPQPGDAGREEEPVPAGDVGQPRLERQFAQQRPVAGQQTEVEEDEQLLPRAVGGALDAPAQRLEAEERQGHEHVEREPHGQAAPAEGGQQGEHHRAEERAAVAAATRLAHGAELPGETEHPQRVEAEEEPAALEDDPHHQRHQHGRRQQATAQGGQPEPALR